MTLKVSLVSLNFLLHIKSITSKWVGPQVLNTLVTALPKRSVVRILHSLFPYYFFLCYYIYSFIIIIIIIIMHFDNDFISSYSWWSDRSMVLGICHLNLKNNRTGAGCACRK